MLSRAIRGLDFAAVALLACTALLAPTAGAAQASYDILIRGGRVLDGTGNPFFYADVGIRGDAIATVGDLSRATATRVIDARGKCVTPGFIAMHEHIEPAILAGYGTLPNFTTQGFTTAVIGADGRDPVWPLSRMRTDLEAKGSALNLVMLVGHGTVRGMAMGKDVERPATPAEIETMQTLVRQGMQDGAFGLSTRVRDKATYFQPFQPSEGINFVLVNGRFVVDGERATTDKPGRVLARQRRGNEAR